MYLFKKQTGLQLDKQTVAKYTKIALISEIGYPCKYHYRMSFDFERLEFCIHSLKKKKKTLRPLKAICGGHLV